MLDMGNNQMGMPMNEIQNTYDNNQYSNAVNNPQIQMVQPLY